MASADSTRQVRPRRTESLVGKRFTRLLVVSEVESAHHNRVYLCRCDCGGEARVNAGKLKSGHTKSCGCWARERATKHGRSSRVVYQSWCSMIQRCRNPKAGHYESYGGRGIKVCERWMEFTNFLADMGEPGESRTLDRIDNGGNYEPGNCRWATRKEQQNNTRRNIFVTLQGRTQTLKQWCEELGVKANTVVCRMRRGWTAERALIEPIGDWHR